MAHIIIKTTKDDKKYYLVWSTVVDTFVTVIAGELTHLATVTEESGVAIVAADVT